MSKQNTRNLVVSSPGPFAPWLHFLKSSGPLSAKADNVSRDRHPVASWQIYPVEGKQRHAIIHRKCVFLHCLRAKALGIEMVGSEGFVANLDFSSACFPCECWNTAHVDGRLFGCMYYLRVQGVVWVEIDRFGAGVCFGMLSSVAEAPRQGRMVRVSSHGVHHCGESYLSITFPQPGGRRPRIKSSFEPEDSCGFRMAGIKGGT